MKTLALTLIAIWSLLGASGAQTTARPITKGMARKAIDLFCADPLSERGQGAASVIVRFADNSPDIEVTITPKTVPWFNNPTPAKHSKELLGAYMAGNIKSQLDTGTFKNDSYSGVIQVIATYRQIQKREPDFKLADVEKLIELATQKKLKSYLETP